MKKRLLFILILIIFSLPSVSSLFNKGFFQSDDGEWMIIRFSAFHQTLRSGEFPVRYLSRLNNEYGYPVADFLYPGFMYLAEIPKNLGFGFVDSVKIIFGLSMIGSSIFVFLWLSKFFGQTEALVGGLFYLYAPYHLYDIYKRGSVGEILGLAIAPFILWQIERKSFFWTTVGIAFLILSHNTLALLFLPVIFAYSLLRKQFSVFDSCILFLLGLGLSSFFWIPAIFDLQYTVFSKTSVSNFTDYFVKKELIGISVIFILILTFILFLNKKISAQKRKITALLLAFGFLSVFFSLEISKLLWAVLPISFFQFPFRFLSIAILCASFLTAVVISVFSKNLKVILIIIVLFLILISSRKFMIPSSFFDKGDSFYSTNQGTTTVKNEYMPKWVKEIPLKRASLRIENLEGKEKINTLGVFPNKVSFQVFLPIQRIIQVNTIYFPGWVAYVNGVKTNITYDNPKGLIRLKLNKGQNNVLIVFKETPVRLITDYISLLSFGFILFFLIRREGKFFSLN